MSKPFKNLKTKMNATAKERAKTKTIAMAQKMFLSEIRLAKEISQEDLANILDTKQASISKIEKRADIHISTLRNYIEALGGKLEIYANFPEGKVEIKQVCNVTRL